MLKLMHFALALALLGAAGFCVFGFLATYEPPGILELRIGYAAAGALCLLGSGWAARRGLTA